MIEVRIPVHRFPEATPNEGDSILIFRKDAAFYGEGEVFADFDIDDPPLDPGDYWINYNLLERRVQREVPEDDDE